MKRGRMLGSKKGQITIFIIIAIVIVAAAVLIYMLTQKPTSQASFDVKNPQGFIQSCLQNTIKGYITNLSLQGGSLNPDFYYTYNGNNVQYLCYTNEYYKTCVVQQPMLIEHVISEIKNAIPNDVSSCFSSLQQNYQNQGYTASVNTGTTVVELLPQKVVITFEKYTVNVTKGETTTYNSFNVVLDNNLYELVSIASNIIDDWESQYGDAPTANYMTYYEDLKVEKLLQGDGTKIYILTNRNTGDKFQFASRSVVYPPGYATGNISTG